MNFRVQSFRFAQLSLSLLNWAHGYENKNKEL
jgi:hypothetical protein